MNVFKYKSWEKHIGPRFFQARPAKTTPPPQTLMTTPQYPWFLKLHQSRNFIQCVCGSTDKTTEMRKLSHVSKTHMKTTLSSHKFQGEKFIQCVYQTEMRKLSHVSNTDTRKTIFSSHKLQGENSSNVFLRQDNRNEKTLSCFQHRHKKHYTFLTQISRRKLTQCNTVATNSSWPPIGPKLHLNED